MKILRIAGRNLASLAGDFEVDFETEPLASSGLFAISGPTGAGKSTLLDALCLALYDATPRLVKGPRVGNYLPDVGEETLSVADRRTLLRRGTAEAFAEVDFAGNDGRRYRARWSVRRSRNRAGGALQPSGMSLATLPDLAPLGGTKTEVLAEIERRIGLSFEQFTRSVLLAQNEFSAFLRTDENERGELLETLTGSAVYSEISRRAFERWRVEQEALRRLTGRLQDQAPLAPDARAALDAEHVEAQARLETVDARRTVLETRLRWHADLARLRHAETEAQTALSQAAAGVEAAGERSRRLATLDAVQPARALLADLARLANEGRQVQARLASSEGELAGALAAQAEARRGLTDAEQRLATGEAALQAAAPDLDRAKALDATVAALVPAHAKARSAREALAREADGARVAVRAGADALAANRQALQHTTDWLDARRAQETLATQWARWEGRLAQAEEAMRTDAAVGAALAQAQETLAAASGNAQRTAAALAAATGGLAEREAARQAAMAALAAFDADALRAERHAAQARRDALATLEAAGSQLAAARARLRELDNGAAQQEAARAAAQEALDTARDAGGIVDGQAAQAERMLKAAQLACADGVEKLRATLADGTPCPVCGSDAHPYRHQDDRLHAVLDGLAQEVARQREAQRANLHEQAAARAAFDAATARLAALGQERAALADGLAQFEDEWRSHPLAREAADAGGLDDDGARRAWFAAQGAQLRAAFADLDAREGALQRALGARDAAQQAWDVAHREHARLQQSAQDDAARLAKGETELAALGARRDAAASNLADIVAELDPVLSAAAGGEWQEGWQASWRRDPAGWRAARAREAAEWTAQAARQSQLAAAIDRLQAEHAATAARLESAARQAQEADAEFARLDADLQGQRTARAALFDGRPVRDIEGALGAAIAAARDSVNACQAASLRAAQREAELRAAQEQARQRGAELQGELAAAGERLQGWIEDFAGSHPDLEPLESEAQLGNLLGVSSTWIAAERAALQELEAAARQAGAVLDERRRQRRQHEDAQAGGDPANVGTDESADDMDAVQARLDAVLLERRAVHEAAAALAVRLREDDGRRERARTMLGEIERQRAIEDRWAKLAELIGSADGKKFRNYAQQFTLDVLLGYANTHLAQLARRYRLERVASNTGPSLSLVVRDQDMGGEVRSVNSLSGGESFLVSLALALGLASLSSNRVKVESLFIDEGFGSLDSDTLGVAMDALDALQSLGRKVGVISHVQEMTERISTKILVRPAGGGSSALTVV
jgi:exonuclease SbcC